MRFGGSGAKRLPSKDERLVCNMSSDDRHKSWTHGQLIMDALKSVQIQGLTGQIRFDEEGKRSNFSLDIVEMSPGSDFIKIGKWSDINGLEISNKRMLHRGFVPNSRNIQ